MFVVAAVVGGGVAVSVCCCCSCWCCCCCASAAVVDDDDDHDRDGDEDDVDEDYGDDHGDDDHDDGDDDGADAPALYCELSAKRLQSLFSIQPAKDLGFGASSLDPPAGSLQKRPYIQYSGVCNILKIERPQTSTYSKPQPASRNPRFPLWNAVYPLDGTHLAKSYLYRQMLKLRALFTRGPGPYPQNVSLCFGAPCLVNKLDKRLSILQTFRLNS